MILRVLALAAPLLLPASPPGAAFCAAGPEYYAIDLVTTRILPGTGLASGTAAVTVPGASPFPVAVAADGSFAQRVDVVLEGLKPPARGTLVAWVTTPDLEQVRRLGPLDAGFRVGGPVAWNKFLVVVTLEPDDDPSGERWRGPVAFRGMSRSGLMHTMAGLGALQQENCASYGY